MEDFYDPRHGSIESHVGSAGFTLVNLDLPGWFISSELKAVFTSRSSWDSVVSDAALHVAPGLAEVLSSSSSEPPSLDFFRGLPKPALTKQWGVYTLLLEHPQLPPVLYVGSGTSTQGGVQERHQRYQSGTGPWAVLVERALHSGCLVDFGILCWTRVPHPQRVPLWLALTIAELAEA